MTDQIKSEPKPGQTPAEQPLPDPNWIEPLHVTIPLVVDITEVVTELVTE